jgi:hypothetical protein
MIVPQPLLQLRYLAAEILAQGTIGENLVHGAQDFRIGQWPGRWAVRT